MADLQTLARGFATKYGLDPDVFTRQIRQESSFNPNARSPAGAVGVAQIMPGTARDWGVDPSNPTAALDAAARHMAGYVKQYGSMKDALVAYNAGPGMVGRPLPAETQNYVDTILGGAANRQPTQAPAMATTGAQADGRGAAIARFLLDKNSDPLQFAMSLRNTQPAPSPSAQGSAPVGGGSPLGVQQVQSRANAISAQHLPYQWGGGHGNTGPGQPLDCSGAVSKVLGINPRVSGEFKSWGQPGDGGNQGVTVYANDQHVFLKVNGHYFGTSGANPGGGAGWIPSSQINPQYLSGFTARHM